MTPRGLSTTISATAPGFGLVIAGTGTRFDSSAIPAAFAQESTPAALAPAAPNAVTNPEAQRAQAYESLVAALASEPGFDYSTVDEAIRDALKKQIDERQAAGDLDIEQAAALAAVIDVTDSPLVLGFGGPGGLGDRGHFQGHTGWNDPGGVHRGPKGGSTGRMSRGGFSDSASQGSEGVTSPSTLPSDGSSFNQSAHVPAKPSARAVSF